MSILIALVVVLVLIAIYVWTAQTRAFGYVGIIGYGAGKPTDPVVHFFDHLPYDNVHTPAAVARPGYLKNRLVLLYTAGRRMPVVGRITATGAVTDAWFLAFKPLIGELGTPPARGQRNTYYTVGDKMLTGSYKIL